MTDPSHGFIAPARTGPMSLGPVPPSEAPPIVVIGSDRGFTGTVTFRYERGMLIRVTQDRDESSHDPTVYSDPGRGVCLE